MNAVIACGGTGGHLFPGIAVAEVLRNRGHEVMLLVSEKDIDALALSGRETFRVEKLPTMGLPSPFSGSLSNHVETERRRAIGDIVTHLRATADIDLGTNPVAWIEKYGNK